MPTTPDSSVSMLSSDGDEHDTASSRHHSGGLLRKGGMVPGQTALLFLSHSNITPGPGPAARYAGRASRTCPVGEGVHTHKRPRLGSTVRDLHFSRAKALQYPTGRPRLAHVILSIWTPGFRDSSWLTRRCRPVHVVIDESWWSNDSPRHWAGRDFNAAHCHVVRLVYRHHTTLYSSGDACNIREYSIRRDVRCFRRFAVQISPKRCLDQADSCASIFCLENVPQQCSHQADSCASILANSDSPTLSDSA